MDAAVTHARACAVRIDRALQERGTHPTPSGRRCAARCQARGPAVARTQKQIEAFVDRVLSTSSAAGRAS